MKRRRFIVGVGGITAVAVGVTSSGALGSTTAERDATVTVENDDNAYLRLIELDSNFAYGTGSDQLEFRFNDDFRAETNDDDQGDGIGSDSVYEFTGVFGVENQGTNPVRVFGIYEDDVLDNVELHEHAPNPSSTPLTASSRSSEINPGESVHITMVLDTEAVDIGTYSTTIKIVAAADDSHVYP